MTERTRGRPGLRQALGARHLRSRRQHPCGTGTFREYTPGNPGKQDVKILLTSAALIVAAKSESPVVAESTSVRAAPPPDRPPQRPLHLFRPGGRTNSRLFLPPTPGSPSSMGRPLPSFSDESSGMEIAPGFAPGMLEVVPLSPVASPTIPRASSEGIPGEAWALPSAERGRENSLDVPCCTDCSTSLSIECIRPSSGGLAL